MKQIFSIFSVMLLLASLLLPLESFAGPSPAKTGPAIPSPAAGSCNNTIGGFCNEFNGAS